MSEGSRIRRPRGGPGRRTLGPTAASLVVLALSTCSSDPSPLTGPSGSPPFDTVSLAPTRNLWVNRDTLSRMPTVGGAWAVLLEDAWRQPDDRRLSDQDSDHDVLTLASALACARLLRPDLCTKATNQVMEAIGTERDARWLDIGRNLTAYVISADVLGLYRDGDPQSSGTQVHDWIASFMTVELQDNIDPGVRKPFVPFSSGSNASAQEGAAFAAVALYLGDAAALERAWDAFRTYACDPEGPDREGINLSVGVEAGWTHDPSNPCAVNPAGSAKEVPPGRQGAGSVHSIDGVIVNDMQRGGPYSWPPEYTHYPWIGLEGFVPAALLLHRAGFPAFETADRAVLRAVAYLWDLGQELGEPPMCTERCWWDWDRARSIKYLVNWYFETEYEHALPTGGGRTIGYADWTHPRR